MPWFDRHLEVAALSGEVDAVIGAIVERLMELDGADGATCSTIEDGLACFKLSLGRDAPLQGRRVPLEQTLGPAALEAGGVAVLRADGDRIEESLTDGAGTIMLAPIEYGGATRGILGVRSSDRRAFDERAVDELRLLARAAAVALRNAEVIERLADSERRYRKLYAQAADAAIVSDLDGNLIEANEAAAELLRYPIDELRRMHFSQLFDADDLERTPSRRDELREVGELRSERRFRRKDGTLVDVEYSTRVLDDGRVQTALRDITERKLDEERLRTNLERLHAIVETQQEISALELDPQAVTRAIVERTQRLTRADGAGVVLFEGDDAVTRHASGIATPQIGNRLLRSKSLAGLSGELGEPLYAADTQTDPRVAPDTFARLHARSLLCAPLRRDGVAIGAMAVMAREPNAFDELAVETTRLMGEFVSTVMHNATELETRRRLVEELRTQGEVVEHMQTSLWIWAHDGATWRLAHANAASVEATGLAAEETVGCSYEEVLPASNGTLRALLDQVRDTGLHADAGEHSYSDGRIDGTFWIKAFPLPGGRVAMTFENVTGRVQATRALQESVSRFRSAFSASALGMALVSLDGAFVETNERLARMLGFEEEELQAMSFRDLAPAGYDLTPDVEALVQMRTGELESYSREKQYLRKDGSVIWCAVTASLVRDYDGRPSHIVVHIEDISAQRDANLLFEATFARSVVPMAIIDDSRRIVEVNDAFASLVAVTHDDALELAIDDLLPDEDVDALWHAFRRHGTVEAHGRLRRPDGQERRIEFVATANVRPGRHIAVVRDLTRQNELEIQLRQAQKMEAVGRLAGGIAHDFNNLLTAIAGYSEFLIDGLEDERLRRHADEIRKASARAASLTGQLLAFSRRQVLQPRVLDLNAVVSDMDMMLRRLIGEDVELVALLDPSLGSVRADPTQVEQVIVNLAVNARDAMPHGGALTVETANVSTSDGDFVELRMSDTGIGMTDEERQQLFDPFFTTKEGGTGLGLATVYGIVEQSGGTIEVDSAPGVGSSFRIWLPRVVEDAEAPASAPTRAEPSTGTETILLVEDEAVVRQLVAEILETSGYSVLQAADGPSALELLRRHTGALELLVTDVVMPGMSGPEVAHAVTSMRPGTQVLYTSGYTDQAIGHHGVLEPDVAFLQKPFSADDLTRKVRALLDGAAMPVD
jgi:PAS domain S-box-containing protein